MYIGYTGVNTKNKVVCFLQCWISAAGTPIVAVLSLIDQYLILLVVPSIEWRLQVFIGNIVNL